MTHCVKKALPIFNRVVVFSTTDFSYHGLPTPLNCPEGWSRKSLALYYYSNGRPAAERTSAHNTLYRKTPDQKRAGATDPTFLNRVKRLLRSGRGA